LSIVHNTRDPPHKELGCLLTSGANGWHSGIDGIHSNWLIPLHDIQCRIWGLYHLHDMIAHHDICSILGSILESFLDLLNWDIQEANRAEIFNSQFPSSLIQACSLKNLGIGCHQIGMSDSSCTLHGTL
jgi:hypothetical protein